MNTTCLLYLARMESKLLYCSHLNRSLGILGSWKTLF
ncbi:unnamed protein product [Arabidopsis lyrata]|nr:unnamed protein product [Arabidopsis lyrata]